MQLSIKNKFLSVSFQVDNDAVLFFLSHSVLPETLKASASFVLKEQQFCAVKQFSLCHKPMKHSVGQI